ncbi:Chloride channel, partial [Globisporangium splendens]
MAERQTSLRAEDAKRKREDDANSALGTNGVSGDNGDGDLVPRQSKRKWTRLLLRELYDLGYNASAAALEHEARVQLRTDAMRQLQTCLETHDWDGALELLSTAADDGEGASAQSIITQHEAARRIHMRSAQAAKEASLLVLKRKFLDFLMKKQLRAALSTFQNEILPFYHLEEAEANDLAVLLLCRDERALEKIATIPWRESELLSRIELLASPDEIIPQGALRRLVQGEEEDGGVRSAGAFAHDAQLKAECTAILLQHASDVLDLRFSPNGEFMASSSRDGAIVIWKLEFQALSTHVSAKHTGKCEREFHHPSDGVAHVEWLPNGNQFLSGSAEKSLVLWNTADGSIAYQWSGRRILDFAIHPGGRKVFILISGVEIREYDLIAKSDELFFKGEHLISCIAISPSGNHLLVNFIQTEEIVCLEIDSETILPKYIGVKEKRFITRPCFIGQQSDIVACGSEDFRVSFRVCFAVTVQKRTAKRLRLFQLAASVSQISSWLWYTRSRARGNELSDIALDTWKQANSPDHFEKLIHVDRKLGAYTFRQLLYIDGSVRYLFKWRRLLIDAVGENSVWGFVIWLFWCCLLTVTSTSCGQFLSPASDGSGIPKMRALFAGVFQNPHDILSFKTFVTKSIGTVMAAGSGVSVGRAGPYTHIVAILAFLMGRMALFRCVHFGPENFNYLRAAVAGGITASFGSPLGGVLFSIEVTAKYYEIKCLWEGVICSSITILVFKIIFFIKRDVLFERTTFTGFDMDWDIFYFVLLGVITGIAAGIFCKLAILMRWVQMKMFKRLGLATPSYKRRLVHVLSICIATGIITYPLKIMQLSDRLFVNEVFRDQPLSLPQWTQITEWPNVTLFIYICLKFCTSILPCGSPLSIGVFGPLFMIGATFGRLYGETLMKHWNPSQSPATYAVVGAACFASSATQTVSTSVIFFELTGQLSHMIPVTLACIVAYFVSGMIAPSIYDILAEWGCTRFATTLTTAKILKLVSNTLEFDKKRNAVVDDISLLNFQKKEEITAASVVGEAVDLSRVHKTAAMCMWTQVYVVKCGKLLGVIKLDSSLTKLRQEEAPVFIAP